MYSETEQQTIERLQRKNEFMTSPQFKVNYITCISTVESILKDRPIGRKSVTTQDRWFFGTGSLCRTFRWNMRSFTTGGLSCQWSVMSVVCHVSGLSCQWSLKTIYCFTILQSVISRGWASPCDVTLITSDHKYQSTTCIAMNLGKYLIHIWPGSGLAATHSLENGPLHPVTH